MKTNQTIILYRYTFFYVAFLMVTLAQCAEQQLTHRNVPKQHKMVYPISCMNQQIASEKYDKYMRYSELQNPCPLMYCYECCPSCGDDLLYGATCICATCGSCSFALWELNPITAVGGVLFGYFCATGYTAEIARRQEARRAVTILTKNNTYHSKKIKRLKEKHRTALEKLKITEADIENQITTKDT